MPKNRVSIKEQLRRNAQRPGGGRPTKTHTAFIGADVDLIDEYEQALADLEKLGDGNEPVRGARLGDPSGRSAIQARIDALLERLEEFAADFRVRGLDDKELQQLTTEHPPRKGADGEVLAEDKQGVNSITFPRAMIRATVISPQLDDEDWALLLGTDDHPGQLTADQIDRFAGVGFNLSVTKVDVPFWHAASPSRQNS